jgi:soluble lytic murein transglycosylase-like protein
MRKHWIVMAAVMALAAVVVGQHATHRETVIERDYLRAELWRALGVSEQAVALAQDATEIAGRYERLLFVMRQHELAAHLVRRVETVNPRAPAERIVTALLEACARYGVRPVLALAVMEQESHYDARARGAAGERGLMQLREETAREVGLAWAQAFDIEPNVEAGVRYLAHQLARTGTEREALARYNGDPVSYPVRTLRRVVRWEPRRG